MRKRNFEIPRWPSELPANQCRPVSPPRQTGRHKLAGNSEGHRGNVIFFVNFVFYKHFWYFKSQFVEVAFFYHLKSQSYIVLCSLCETVGVFQCQITLHTQIFHLKYESGLHPSKNGVTVHWVDFQRDLYRIIAHALGVQNML